MGYNIGMSSATPSRFSDFDFVQQAALWLSLAHEGDIDPVDKNMLRKWLAEAPGRMNQTSLAVWVSLTGLLVWITHDEEQAHPSDGPLVRAVLDHAVGVPIHVWMAEGHPLVESIPNPNYVPSEDDDPEEHENRPAYDALRGLTGMLAMAEAGLGPHPTLSAVLASGWEPGPLLGHLDQAREIQALYVETEYTPKTHTAQGYLICGILSAIGTSDWRPQAHPALAMLWDKDAHDYYRYEGSISSGELPLRNTEKRHAAQRTLAAFPEYAGLALNTFLDWTNLRRLMGADAFFPFPFEKSHETDTLHALVRCWQQRNGGAHLGSPNICAGLIYHHPEVANLLEMHCSFYTQPNHALNNLPSIMGAFEHVVGVRENQTLSIDHLDLGS